MPQPNTSSVHISAPLTNVSVAYKQNAEQFIAGKVFPEIPVDHQADLFWTVPKGDWFRDEARPRPDATESVGSGYELATDSYVAIVEAIHKDVGDQARRNADNNFNLDSQATEFVTDRLLLRREVAFNSSFLKTGVWGRDITGVASAPNGTQFIKWSDYDNSNPVKDIKREIRRMVSTTGMKPNTLVLGYDVFDALTEHPYLLDKFKYTSSDLVTTAIVAKYFGLQNVYVSEAVLNSGKEGQADSFDFITGKVALLAYVAPTPGLLTPSAGYSFAWKGVSSGIGSTVGVQKFRMPELKADRVEGEIAYANKVVAADLGTFFSAVVD